MAEIGTIGFGTTLELYLGTPRERTDRELKEAAMRHGDKHNRNRLHKLAIEENAPSEESHVVFDFTGLEQANVGDLSLILTARLQSAPTENVWVRSLPARTAQVLRILRLDHLFRQYPEGKEMVN
jgi:hypothetical protein